jgi:acyl carrier protein
MSDTLEQQVIDIVANAKSLDPGGLSSSTTMEELALDSLDGMSIVFDLENAFEIEIPEDAAEQAKTIGDLVEGVRQLVAARAAE